MKNSGGIIFFVYLLIALYLVNSAFSFIVLPEAVTNFNQWITLVGAVLISLAGLKYLQAPKKP